MIRPLLIAALVAALPSAAHAADARLVSRLYNPDEVVRIEGRAGVQATVAFAEDEHIENVAVGDANSWQITPNKRANLLFVKPLNPRARTNMTVVTDRHTYLFDLVAAPTGTPLYVLRFTYPEAPKPALAAQSDTGLNPAESAALENPAAVRPADPATLNFAWRGKGSGKLIPARIYDDGQSTYLGWAVGTPIPAILIRDARGSEGPVNFAVRGDVIVVDGVPGLIVLRLGRESATIENQGEPRKPAEGAALAAALPAQTEGN